MSYWREVGKRRSLSNVKCLRADSLGNRAGRTNRGTDTLWHLNTGCQGHGEDGTVPANLEPLRYVFPCGLLLCKGLCGMCCHAGCCSARDYVVCVAMRAAALQGTMWYVFPCGLMLCKGLQYGMCYHPGCCSARDHEARHSRLFSRDILSMSVSLVRVRN